jgi:S-ribosylhomocysteine lyase LuxS involved in autoinducer biosynthesis
MVMMGRSKLLIYEEVGNIEFPPRLKLEEEGGGSTKRAIKIVNTLILLFDWIKTKDNESGYIHSDEALNILVENSGLSSGGGPEIMKELGKSDLVKSKTNKDIEIDWDCVYSWLYSSPSGRHAGHYLACIDLKDELSVILAAVHTTMMSVLLAEGFCPERWRQAIYIMLEKIPGVPRIKKLRIIQLLEADLNQVLCSTFARNISKLAQETPGIISKHQYGRSHQTCLTPVLKNLLAVQILKEDERYRL